MLRCFVTGGAGFIGSNLCDRLLNDGHQVVAYDNFSTGMGEFLQSALDHHAFSLIKGDTLDLENLTKAMRGSDVVFHLAANADVRFGTQHTRRDLEQNTIATYNVLEAMRATGVGRIAFSSTGSVYGEPEVHPTPEDAPFPVQTSLYAASKVASEALIQAYCEGFGIKGWIFRFVSVLGERYSHGHVFDFCRKLLADPTRLKVLGDGRQKKSYMYVQDCLDAILLALEAASEKVNIFNLGVDGYTEVNQSIAVITRQMEVSPKLEYSGGKRGWVGDSPFIYLDTARISALGWQPKVDILKGVEITLQWLLQNRWVFEVRD